MVAFVLSLGPTFFFVAFSVFVMLPSMVPFCLLIHYICIGKLVLLAKQVLSNKYKVIKIIFLDQVPHTYMKQISKQVKVPCNFPFECLKSWSKFDLNTESEFTTSLD